jgi:hypothetical protein
MKSPWRLLALAAALHMTLGTGTALAQRVMLRHAPPGSPVEIFLNAEKVADGTVGADGDVTIEFTLPPKDGKAEIDANVFVDVCDKLHKVVVVDRNRAALPVAEGCDRREVAGLFWVRPVNTLVVDVAPQPPTMLLVRGKYTPPTPQEITEEGEDTRPREPLPKGFMMFAGLGPAKLRDFATLQCGNVNCSGGGTVLSYGFGATFWLTRFVGVEGSYLHPVNIKVSGGEGFHFDTEMDADIWSIVGKGGIQAGKARLYGQVGMNYHDATVTTVQTIAALGAQRFITETKGWNPTYGGGLEIWVNKKIAIYGEFDFAQLKGDAEGGGEAKIDDRASVILGGIRLHLGG